MEPVKTPKQWQEEKEADHEQDHTLEHIKRHLNPRWLEWEVWRASLSSKDKESYSYCQVTSKEVRIIHHRDTLYHWLRCGIQRAWLEIIRRETVGLTDLSRALTVTSFYDHARHVLTRAERAHWPLPWDQRLARNACPSDAPRLVVTLRRLPAAFASSFGFDLLATA